MLVLDRNRFFDFAEFSSRIVEERGIAGAIRVLELIVRIVLRVWLFGMFFPPIDRFSFRINPALSFGLDAASA